MTDIELLPMPRTLQHADDADLAAHVQDYARACVAHATEPLQAEIEALRVRADAMAGEAIKHEARAERLAEALDAVVTFAVCYQLSEGDQCVVDARALLHPAAAQEGK